VGKHVRGQFAGLLRLGAEIGSGFHGVQGGKQLSLRPVSSSTVKP
jgi:hypothetical protein